jgi:hypothetical protein
MRVAERKGEPMARILVAAFGLLLIAGCSAGPMYVYKPSAPSSGGRKLPLKLAVLPFSDATEDFTQRGSLFQPENLAYNLAKTGIQGRIDALTPGYWAKAFAEETAASGDFRSVRFVYAESELSGEDYRIEGTVEKATIRGGEKPNEFAVRFRAFRAAERAPLWEKSVSRSWKRTPAELVAECGPGNIDCRVERHRRDLDQAMRDILTEARADLVRILAPRDGGDAQDGLPVSAPPPGGESVDETIGNILKTP